RRSSVSGSPTRSSSTAASGSSTTRSASGRTGSSSRPWPWWAAPARSRPRDLRPMTTFCVQWPRFGPYHLARLDATAARPRARGVRRVGRETASRDDQCAWREERRATDFERVTLLPGATFEETPPARLHAAMTEALDRIRPDAVGIHSYAWPDARAALAWCRRHRRGAVLMFDSNADDGVRRGWREWIKRRIVSQYDAGLIAGTRQARYAVRLGLPEDAVFLGYDVVDNDFFRDQAEAARHDPASRALPGLDDPTPFFLASNRFLIRKNLPLLLRAYHGFRRRMEQDGLAPWRLVMLGDGPLREELERIVAENAIGGVTFAGFRQIDEIPAYYAHASAVVHPSEVDQWALVVNEAMATGLPVVVS